MDGDIQSDVSKPLEQQVEQVDLPYLGSFFIGLLPTNELDMFFDFSVDAVEFGEYFGLFLHKLTTGAYNTEILKILNSKIPENPNSIEFIHAIVTSFIRGLDKPMIMPSQVLDDGRNNG